MALLNILSMIVDRYGFGQYPFRGSFIASYMDDRLPLEEREDKEYILIETDCDIQESHKSDASGLLVSSYNVYFPFDVTSKDIPVRRGMKFRGFMYGIEVNGVVVGVKPSQLGGVVCYVKDVDAE